MATFTEDLAFRGLMHQVTDPAIVPKPRPRGLTVYVGFDPTADSLHVGSLLPAVHAAPFPAGRPPAHRAGRGGAPA